MKWGFASTAAIIRAHQKDLFYRRQLEDEFKAVLLDFFNFKWFLRLEEYIPLLVDLGYYTILVGRGQRTLGEEYAHVSAVDLKNGDFLAKNRLKRVLWIVLRIVLPFGLGKLSKNSKIGNLLESIIIPTSSIMFYFSGRFPSWTDRFLSTRYVAKTLHIYFPRKSPLLDADSSFYRGLGAVLLLITLEKAINLMKSSEAKKILESQSQSTSTHMKSAEKHKCPVCLEFFHAAFGNSRCGHAYCQQCIAKWMEIERREPAALAGGFTSACPICRVSFAPTHLIPLLNLK